MSVYFNPGTGPVADASEHLAVTAMLALVADVRARGVEVASFARHPAGDDGQGRFAFLVTLVGGRLVEVEMPGWPLERVRWMNEPGQNIWDFPRLYVDGSSWVWFYAVRRFEAAGDEGAP